MTKEELFRAVGEVREDQITEAETVKKANRPWRRYGALAACLALAVAGAFALERLEDARKWTELQESFQTADTVHPESAPDAGGGEDERHWKTPRLQLLNRCGDRGAAGWRRGKRGLKAE